MHACKPASLSNRARTQGASALGCTIRDSRIQPSTCKTLRGLLPLRPHTRNVCCVIAAAERRTMHRWRYQTHQRRSLKETRALASRVPSSAGASSADRPRGAQRHPPKCPGPAAPAVACAGAAARSSSVATLAETVEPTPPWRVSASANTVAPPPSSRANTHVLRRALGVATPLILDIAIAKSSGVRW